MRKSFLKCAYRIHYDMIHSLFPPSGERPATRHFPPQAGGIIARGMSLQRQREIILLYPQGRLAPAQPEKSASEAGAALRLSGMPAGRSEFLM